MKKILLILAFFCCVLGKAQSNRPSMYRQSDKKVGYIITIGGVSFLGVGFLTPINYTSVTSTSSSTFVYVKQPFMQQGPRAACIVTGITVTMAGLITMLAKK